MLMPHSSLYFTTADIQVPSGTKANLCLGIWALWESTGCFKTSMALFYVPGHVTGFVICSAMATIRGCFIVVTNVM